MQQYLPFTVLKLLAVFKSCLVAENVATVLTVYGIETYDFLEQRGKIVKLQQYLPFTVLKLITKTRSANPITGCNSTYRLRY